MRRSCPRWWRSAPEAAPRLDTRRPSGMRLILRMPSPKTAAHFSGRATSPLLFMARGTPASPIVPTLDSEGARNAGRPIASAASCAWVEFGHTSFSHHESTGSSGVPHAGVFSACFACPPVGGPLIPTVVVERAARPSLKKALRTVPCYGARHRAGSTRFGPTREAMSVGRISAPAASHSVVVSLGARLARAPEV